MCNLYSITTNQAAIRRCFASSTAMSATSRRCRACFRTIRLLLIRNSDGELEMTMMRWACRRHREPVDTRHQHPEHFVTTLAGVAQC